MNHATLEQKKNDETKTSYNGNKKKIKNKNITLKFLEGRRNRNFLSNMNSEIATSDPNNKNCYLFSSIKRTNLLIIIEKKKFI